MTEAPGEALAGADPSPGFLRAFAETRAFLLGRPVRATPTPDGSAVLFLRGGPREAVLRLYETDVVSGATRELVTPRDLLGGAEETLSVEERARRERLRITDRGFTWFALSPDGARVLLTLSGRLFLFDRATGAARALTPAEAPAATDARFSPDGERVAFVRERALHVLDVARPGRGRRLLAPRLATVTCGRPEFIAQEEMGRHEGYWWAPDGKTILCTEVDEAAVETFAIADPAHPERPPVTFRYPRAGRANADVRLHLVPAAGGRARPVVWDRDRYPYLARVDWRGKAPASLLVQSRDQREAAFLAVDPRTGATRPLLVERDDAWINLDRDTPRWLPDGAGFFWVSEANGRRALELRGADGALRRVLVDAGYLALPWVAQDGRAARVLVGDPLQSRLLHVELDGRAAREVKLPAGDDHAIACAENGAAFVATSVGVGTWPRATVCRGDGTPAATLPDVAETPPFAPRVALAPVGDAGIYTAVLRPRAFDPRRRYPVIVRVYGGPHALMVKADARHYLYDQWLADRGAVVVLADGRGTPRRDRAWERAIKGRFGEVPLADQIEALRALAALHPEMDLARVGIYGWSFGGYLAALAVMRRPDVFKVAVAGAPVVDWSDYDTHYTERYLDSPARAPDAYRDASLLTHAGSLSRPLLIIHGTADDNVYFFHSQKLVDALVRAGRPVDFLPLPGVTHQIADPRLREEVWRRTADYLLARLASA